MFAQLQRVLKSYSFQFFLSTSLIFVVVSTLIFALLFAYFTRQQSIDLQRSIKNELDRVEQVYNDMGTAQFIDATNHLNTEYTISNFYYLLINTSGKKVAGDLNQWPGVIPKTKKPGSGQRTSGHLESRSKLSGLESWQPVCGEG